MTARYTNEEWTDKISAVSSSLKIDTATYPLPQLGTTAFAKTIDHTLLKLDATEAQIDDLCNEARREDFATVCVRLKHVARAHANLRGSNVGIACVIGFHEGTADLNEKSKEAQSAISLGATELDIVLNRTHLLATPPSYTEIFNELATLRSLCPPPIILKLIFETSALSADQIIAASTLACYASFDYIKTSTGFGGRGASIDDVRLMYSVIKALGRMGQVHVKASGGIRSLNAATDMIAAGATRLGTSSGVWIAQEARKVVEDRSKSPNGAAVEGNGGRPGGGVTRLYTDNSITEY